METELMVLLVCPRCGTYWYKDHDWVWNWNKKDRQRCNQCRHKLQERRINSWEEYWQCLAELKKIREARRNG